jgi:hypothetical protein
VIHPSGSGSGGGFVFRMANGDSSSVMLIYLVGSGNNGMERIGVEWSGVEEARDVRCNM